jgi:hypothetical protein
MLRVLWPLSFVIDQYCWKHELPNIFLVEISGTEFQQNLWKALWDSDLLDFGLHPTSGILESTKHNVSETGSVSTYKWEGRDTYSVGSLRKS